MTTTAPTLRTDLAVRLVDVSKSYPGAETVHALRGISLDLPRGSLTAIMGQSGSGKSTLLNCAAGLDVPTRGQVFIGEHDISTLSPDALTRFRRENVGFIFQSYNLVAHLTVEANIQLPLMLGGRKPDRQWQSRLISSLGLGGLEHRLPGELSGGQAQRVAIARALLTVPTVVFADEPTGALDSRTGAEVLEVFGQTARRLNQTVVLVTHDPKVAATAERVLFLADGQIVDQLESPTAEKITTRMLGLGR